MKAKARQQFASFRDSFPNAIGCLVDIEHAFDVLVSCYQGGRKVLVCGNGGSAADAEHIVGELMKGFMEQRALSKGDALKVSSSGFPEKEMYLSKLQMALPAISLVSQTSLCTAFSNDQAAELVFAQQVYGYGREGDVLIALSTSGGSRNVVHAVKVARIFGLKTIGLTGRTGGDLAALCDVCIRVPEDRTYRIQELHLPVYHCLCAMVEAEIFG